MGLILVVLGLLGLGVVAFSWWRLSEGGLPGGRTAQAKVVESVPCGKATRGDLVEVRIDGKVRRLRLDGCGHNRGQEFQVQVPQSGDRAFRAGDATGDSGPGTRISWVLGTLAAVAGGGYVLLLRRPDPA